MAPKNVFLIAAAPEFSQSHSRSVAFLEASRLALPRHFLRLYDLRWCQTFRNPVTARVPQYPYDRGHAATREEAMAEFKAGWERGPPQTGVSKGD
jgi:hypothetical protein